jgi:hypothetical protein
MSETKLNNVYLGRRTCKCKKDVLLYSAYDDKLQFYKWREYKVELFDMFYHVFLVDDYYHYVSLNQDEFDKYFELIP